MQIRAARPDEQDQFLTVLCGAFNLDRSVAEPLFYHDPYFDLSHKRVLVSPDSEIVSCLTIIPTPIRIGNAIVPVGGIAGVSTPLAHRRRGFAGELLSETIRTMSSDHGFPLAGLFPVEPAYYARFGFAFAAESCRWRGAPRDLPVSPLALSVRPIDMLSSGERAALDEIYHARTADRTGACIRNDRRWKVILEMIAGRETFIFAEKERITGYIHCEPIPDGSRLIVHEMHALTRYAIDALLGFLAGQGNFRRIEWIASVADLAYFGLPVVPTAPDAMLRITDLAAALRLLHPGHVALMFAERSAQLAIVARDDIHPANQTPILLAPDGVHVTKKVAASEPAISADIRMLTQLYLGYRTPSQALVQGELSASSDEAVILADALFPKRSPHIPSLDRF